MFDADDREAWRLRTAPTGVMRRNGLRVRVIVRVRETARFALLMQKDAVRGHRWSSRLIRTDRQTR